MLEWRTPEQEDEDQRREPRLKAGLWLLGVVLALAVVVQLCLRLASWRG